MLIHVPRTPTAEAMDVDEEEYRGEDGGGDENEDEGDDEDGGNK
jgi:hypothetical protein